MNASKIAAIVRAATDDVRDVEAFTLGDALTLESGFTVADAETGYVNGNEAVINGTVSRTASAALVAGTAVQVGTLTSTLWPHAATSARAAAYLSGGLIASPGHIDVSTAGVVTFTPDSAVSAAAGMKFTFDGLRFLLAGGFSDDVVADV